MTKKGYHVFIAYADPEAGERGVIFRACNFLYCGTTSPTEKFRRPDGKVYDARNVHLLTRDRRFGRLRYKRSRAEQKQLLIEQGCEFFKDTGCKHRFVGIFGDRRMKRTLRRALKWQVLPFPKLEAQRAMAAAASGASVNLDLSMPIQSMEDGLAVVER